MSLNKKNMIAATQLEFEYVILTRASNFKRSVRRADSSLLGCARSVAEIGGEKTRLIKI